MMGFDPERHKAGIGGSDIAAIVGESPWSSAWDVWAEKTGRSGPSQDNEATELGRDLEGPIAQRYQRRHPEVRVAVAGPRTHPQKAWIRGSADRVCYTPDDSETLLYGLEIKTSGLTGGSLADTWGDPDDVPLGYQLQCLWYMGLYETSRWDVAAILGMAGYREYSLQFDAEMFGLLAARADAFWHDYVLTDTPPPIDSSEGCKATLARFYPTHDRDILVVLPGDPREGLLEALAEARRVSEEAQANCRMAENLVKAEIGAHAGIRGACGSVSWKANKNGTRALRVRLGKESDDE